MQQLRGLLHASSRRIHDCLIRGRCARNTFGVGRESHGNDLYHTIRQYHRRVLDTSPQEVFQMSRTVLVSQGEGRRALGICGIRVNSRAAWWLFTEFNKSFDVFSQRFQHGGIDDICLDLGRRKLRRRRGFQRAMKTPGPASEVFRCSEMDWLLLKVRVLPRRL